MSGSLVLASCGSDDDGDDQASGEPAARFDGDRAFSLIEEQVALGPRPAGSPASRKLADQLVTELPNGEFEDVPGGLRNVVGTLPGPGPAIVVGAHYDTEVEPPDFVGANDGAAGTAAVVELARTLESGLPEGHREIRFVLFDGEEEPPGCPEAQFEQCALRGSKAYVQAHRREVGEMILLDYIANRGLEIPREQNSNPQLWQAFVDSAAKAGADGFISLEPVQFGIIDDHIPFLLAGIPAIDVIDFSYKHADTSEDTVDKLDPAALDAGRRGDRAVPDRPRVRRVLAARSQRLG